MIRTCKICDFDFDDRSPEKQRAGGLITHCPECAEETSVKVVGVAGGDGKQINLEILQFDTERDKQIYLRHWKQNSGMNKGKSCQIGRGLMSVPKVKFRKVTENRGNTNHKGKL